MSHDALTCEDFTDVRWGCCPSCHEDADLEFGDYPLCELSAAQTGRGKPAVVCCQVATNIDDARKRGCIIGADHEEHPR